VTKKQRIPLPAVVALIVVGALLVQAAGYFVLISPKRTQASDLTSQIADTQQKIDENRIATMQAGKTEPIQVADLFRLAKAMPDRADMSGVLLELNRVAADTGITFESIAPQTSVPISGYQAMPIQVTFQGNFYNLSDFLYRLRNLVSVEHGRLAASGRLFAVDTLNFAEAQKGFPEITATLVIDAFVYGTGAPATVAPTTTDTTGTATTTTPTTTEPAATPPPSAGASAAGATS
jgi:type IV pilus assembly PilO-like protein